MKKRFTVEPGRAIHADGKPCIYIGRDTTVGLKPYAADRLTHLICALLNQRDAFTRINLDPSALNSEEA